MKRALLIALLALTACGKPEDAPKVEQPNQVEPGGFYMAQIGEQMPRFYLEQAEAEAYMSEYPSKESNTLAHCERIK